MLRVTHRRGQRGATAASGPHSGPHVRQMACPLSAAPQIGCAADAEVSRDPDFRLRIAGAVWRIEFGVEFHAEGNARNPVNSNTRPQACHLFLTLIRTPTDPIGTRFACTNSHNSYAVDNSSRVVNRFSLIRNSAGDLIVMKRERSRTQEGGLFLPTPAQIRKGCERIRMSWSAARLSRRPGDVQEWTVPLCRLLEGAVEDRRGI